MSKRLDDKLHSIKSMGRKSLFIYITAGITSKEAESEAPLIKIAKSLYSTKGISTADLLLKMSEAGADVIELGLPFSDPMADGPVIQEATVTALSAGMTLRGALDIVREFRKKNDDTPIIGMGYFNNILRYGLERFARDAVEAGMDGIIVPDLPHEESGEFRPLCAKSGLALIEFVTPSTNNERMQEICKEARGFVYCISHYGVTGVKEVDYEPIGIVAERARRYTECPMAIGFGIGSPEAAIRAAKYGDAVIVGSVIVKKILEDDIKGATEFVSKLRHALDDNYGAS